MDHVFNPTLTDSAFVTEVYHIDDSGRELGVVFSEMQGRENTESDLLERSMKKALFSKTGYSFETGGLTPEIATLTNKEIQDYHKKYYHPSNASIMITGMADKATVLDIISRQSELMNCEAMAGAVSWNAPIPPLSESKFETQLFPSSGSF